MERIPLRAGKSTPQFADDTLAIFGKNPHGEPMYRLIWSERKMIWFAGEVAPEYLYIAEPCWIIEVWTDPLKDAGIEALWNEMQEQLMGPYPRKGTYNLFKSFEPGWEPTTETIRLLAVALEESKDFDLKTREAAIREGLEQTAKEKREEVAKEIVESFGSAELGKTTQAASGRPNVFRTADDFGRDLEKFANVKPIALPKSGGKIIQ
jgi:hypothetical protein